MIEVPGQFYEVKVSFLDDLPPDLLRKVGPCPPDLPGVQRLWAKLK